MGIGQSKFRALERRVGALLQEPRAREIFANNLLKEFSYTHRLLKSLGHPKIYQIETTNHCPYTCNMCPRTHAMTRELGHMDIGLFRSILDQMQPAWQADHIVEEPSIGLWHFGEPMLYKHFTESVSYAHDRGLRVHISTNPSVWTARRIDELLAVGVDELYVMVDGMDDSTSMAIRGRAASFTRGEANVRLLIQRKTQLGLSRPRIHICMVKQSRNAHQWGDFTAYWTGFEGVESVYLGQLSTFAGDVPALTKLNDVLASHDPEQSSALSHQCRLSKLPCYYPWHSVSVTWDGKVVPCCRDHNASLVLGDLTKQSLESIWNGPPMQDLRRQFANDRVTAAPCVTCKERSLEIGLPGSHYPISLINLKRLVATVTGSTFP